ncbi:hypothetical protein, conserved in T. vivax [Trypanosoma vivax Y486]|uniref:Uncharacterized protein n=1 Tax=Trypanosoma vivax (strain Y486) TaxID=1055687 RepID=F9WQC9_TRYVY|nr:hypothetical protein, conserved in T. vivax [Trypanosoma vivax Y486]|eukprot:CCD19756.1 hypothetical protein, conserved in T. vivax [Trypanosoma vivax Y486]
MRMLRAELVFCVLLALALGTERAEGTSAAKGALLLDAADKICAVHRALTLMAQEAEGVVSGEAARLIGPHDFDARDAGDRELLRNVTLARAVDWQARDAVERNAAHSAQAGSGAYENAAADLLHTIAAQDATRLHALERAATAAAAARGFARQVKEMVLIFHGYTKGTVTPTQGPSDAQYSCIVNDAAPGSADQYTLPTSCTEEKATANHDETAQSALNTAITQLENILGERNKDSAFSAAADCRLTVQSGEKTNGAGLTQARRHVGRHAPPQARRKQQAIPGMGRGHSTQRCRRRAQRAR